MAKAIHKMRSLLLCAVSLLAASSGHAGTISTVAGNGTAGFAGDGAAATAAQINQPQSIAVDAAGNIYIADRTNERVRKVDAGTGLISTIAGTGTAGFNGDGIAATTAQLNTPFHVAVDGSGNVFITDRLNHRIRKIDSGTGLISTVAGTGVAGYNGDGIAATTAQLNNPTEVFVDASGNIYTAEQGGHRVRKVDNGTGLISTIAGTGTLGFNGDGIAATTAQLNEPHAVYVNAAGDVYIADNQNHRVRKIDNGTGLISTVAGTGAQGFNGDAQAATAAQLNNPIDLYANSVGDIYIADRVNHRIRRVDVSTGLIHTAAGIGTGAFSGDGGPAVDAAINNAQGVFVDAANNVYIADRINHRIRKITAAPDLQIAGKIVFQTNRDGQWEIYSMDPDGSNQVRLTNDAGADVTPVLSPDGTKIAFRTDRTGDAEIFVMNSDGSDPVNVTNSAASVDGSPSWSPDDTKIAFDSNRTGNNEIFVMNADGTNPVNLTNNANSDLSPHWAPDGSKIGFVSDRVAAQYGVWVMDSNGANPTQLTVNTSSNPLAWSPNGSRILFSGGTGVDEVNVMNSNGTGQTDLTNAAGSAESARSWSPDGTMILLQTDRDGDIELYAMRDDGSALRRLTNSTFGEQESHWAPFRHIGSTAMGKSVARTMTVTNTGMATLNVTNITSSSGLFTISPTSFSVNTGASQNVTVTVTPSATGTVYSTLTITSDDPDDPTTTLTINGRGTVFTEVAVEVGVANVLTTISASLFPFAGDYDNDGDLDVYVTRAATDVNLLYRNQGDGTFTEVGSAAGVDDNTNSIGGAWGDYDNDGDIDLQVSTFQAADRLYRNNGNGTFTNDAVAAGVADAGEAQASAWADFDEDGYIDLYITRNSQANLLYKNNGNGTFTDVGGAAGVADAAQGRGTSWADYDDDGDLDLYVTQSASANLLYRNNGNSTFTDVAAAAGVNVANGFNSLEWADYDRDGDLDVYLVAETAANSLFRNNGNGTFTDVAVAAGSDDTGNSGKYATWSDYDNDGDLDIYISDNVPAGVGRLLENDGAGSFTDVAANRGLDVRAEAAEAMWLDHDNDGDMDLFAASRNVRTRFYRNNGNSNRWLHVKLVGSASNRSGIGAKIFAVEGAVRRRRDVDGSTGSGAQPSLPVEFGFGAGVTTLDSLIIHWPSGLIQRLAGISTNQVLTVTEPSQTISTVAGTGTAGFNGDGIAATTAQLNVSVGVFVDGSGNIYIADQTNHRIRKVDLAGNISTVAGTGTAGYNGDGMAATTAQLNQPTGVFVVPSGEIYIADNTNHRIRKVDLAGNISTVAGTGTAGFNSDGIAATAAQLNDARAVFVDESGSIYIADAFNHRVRKIDLAGNISTVAGTGTSGFNGDGIAATAAQVNQPNHIFVTESGLLYIADKSNNRVRQVDLTGNIGTVAGTGTAGFNGDGIAATTAQLNAPAGVFVDGSGNIFVTDESNHRLRKVDLAGALSTVAGTGTAGYNGDGIAAARAQLNVPRGVFVDESGGLFIAERTNHRIRKVTPPLTETTKAAGLSSNTGTSAGQEVQLLSIGLTGDAVATLSDVSVVLSDLSAPTGLVSGDISELRLYRSADASLGGDTQIGSQGTVTVGGPTRISVTATEFPPNGTEQFYIVSAVIAGGATLGHAFKVGFSKGGVNTTFTGVGSKVTASDANKVTFLSLSETTVAAGLTGASAVGSGGETKIFSIGITGDGSSTLNSVTLTISDLTSATGLVPGDFTSLRLYRSTDAALDGSDTQLGSQSTVNVGSATTISPTATETPPSGVEQFYLVSAKLNTTLTDGRAFKVGFAAGGVSTGLGAKGTAVVASDANKMTIDVVATQLTFITQPGESVHGQPLTTQPVVQAQDANGNLDKDFIGTVTLTASAGSVTNNTATAVAGVAAFDGVVSGSGLGRTLIASTTGLSSGTSASFEVNKAQASVTLPLLEATYDGTAKSAAATTNPANLSVTFAYDAGGTPLGGPPIGPGVFGVAATVNDGNYEGSTTGGMTIHAPAPPVASLQVSPSQGNAPLIVTYTISATGFSSASFLETRDHGGLVSDNTYAGTTSFGTTVQATYSAPGTHTAVLTVRGPGGSSQAQTSVTVNAPPTVDDIADASAPEDQQIELDLTGKDAGSGTWSVSGTDGSLIAEVSVVGDMIVFTPVTNAFGSDVVTITRTSVHGLTASQDVTLTWTAVNDPPKIAPALAASFTAAEEDGIHVAGPGNASDEDTDVIALVWGAEGFDGGLVASAEGGPNGIDFTPHLNANGQTTVTIELVDPGDGARATQDVTLTWTPVNDPPSAPIAGFPGNGATEVTLTPQLSWESSDPDGDALTYDLSFGQSSPPPLVQSGSGTTYSPMNLAPGTTYTWQVTARDPEDTSASSSFNFTTEEDLLPPVISEVLVAPDVTSVTFNWRTDEAALVRVRVVAESGGAFEGSSATSATQQMVTVSGLEAATRYTYELFSTDLFGNESPAFAGNTLTLAAPDETSPQFLGDPFVEGITDESAVVRWATDEPSNSVVRYQTIASAKPLDLMQAVEEVRSEGLVIDHLVRLSGLIAGATYSFETSSEDAAGNAPTVRSGQFTIAAIKDDTQPGFVARPAIRSITDLSARVDFETNELTTVQVRFDTDEGLDDGRAVESIVARTVHQLELTGLEPSTTYFYQVFIADETGNSATSALLFFGTRAAPDVRPATILTGPAVQGLTEISGVLVLTTDEPTRVQALLSTAQDLSTPSLKESGQLTAEHSLSLTNLESGTQYFYEVLVRDASYNETAPVRSNFQTLETSDTTPPQFVRLPFAEGVNEAGATITWSADELTRSVLSFAQTNAAKVLAGSAVGVIRTDLAREHRVQLTQLIPGARYDGTAALEDAQGNAAPAATFSFSTLQTDVGPPLVETGPDVQGISDAGASIEVTYNEPVELILRYGRSFDLTGAEQRTVSARKRSHREELTGLEPATPYFVGLIARDAIGNSSSERLLSFVTEGTRDETAPTFVDPPFTTDISGTSARIVWNLDEPGDALVAVATRPDLSDAKQEQVLNRQKEHSVVVTNLTADTDYFYQVSATDASGNTGRSRVLDFKTLGQVVALPPEITVGPVAEKVANHRATIFWRTDIEADAQVDYFPTATPAELRTETRGVSQTTHRVVLTNLLAGTDYSFTVRSRARQGLVSLDRSSTFTTESDADTVPPKFIGPPTVSDVKQDRVRIEWRSDEPSDSRLVVTGPNGFEQIVTDPKHVKNHALVLTNLAANTEFTFQTFCTDRSGNQSQWRRNLAFRTAAVADVLPPRFNRIPVIRGRTQNSLVLGFTTSEPALATLDYGTTTAYELGRISYAGQQIEHELRLGRLKPGTTYHLRVGVTDGDGNQTFSGDISVATLDVRDERPPHVNSGPIVVSTSEDGAVFEVTIDEPASLALTYSGNGETRTATEPDLRDSHRLVLTNLAADHQYEYSMLLRDAAGNATTTASARFKTRATPDILPPRITSGPTFQGVATNQATVTWTTSEPASSIVDWRADVASGKAVERAGILQSGGSEGRIERGDLVENHSITLSELVPGTHHDIVVTSRDQVGNEVTTDPSGTELHSKDHSFRTLDSQDRVPPKFTENPTATWTNETAVVQWGTDEQATSRVDWIGGGKQGFVEDNDLRFNHGLTLTNLIKRTAYQIKVSSQDEAGNLLEWGSIDGPRKVVVDAAAKILQPPAAAASSSPTTRRTRSFPSSSGAPGCGRRPPPASPSPGILTN